MTDQSSDTWKAAEQAVVDGDVVTLDALLRDHGQMLRTGPVQSTWWGGLAPSYAQGDARSIIAREHCFESWDQFAAHAESLTDGNSTVARFEAAVDAVITGDATLLEGLLRTNPELVRARSMRTHHSTLLQRFHQSSDFPDSIMMTVRDLSLTGGRIA